MRKKLCAKYLLLQLFGRCPITSVKKRKWKTGRDGTGHLLSSHCYIGMAKKRRARVSQTGSPLNGHPVLGGSTPEENKDIGHRWACFWPAAQPQRS